MATISAAGAGNWSATGTWTGGVVPGDGDTAAIGTYIVVMDIPTIPATGTLAGITFTSGGLTIDMSATGFNANGTINCASTIVAGTSSSGSLRVSVASSNTLTVNCGLTGGSTTNDSCLNITADVTVVVNGNVTGGSAGNAYGIASSSAGAITVTGNVTGGSSGGANGIRQTSFSPGLVTLNSCNIIDGTNGTALACSTPTWNKSATNYYETGGIKFYYDVPDKANVRETDTVAGVAGTIATRTLSTANDTVEAGYYAATTLSAVDADLVAANIVTGKTIFGINGSASGGGGVIVATPGMNGGIN